MIGDRRVWRVLRDPKQQVSEYGQQNLCDQRDYVTHLTYPMKHVGNVTDVMT